MTEILPTERIDDIGRGMKLIQSTSTPCFSIDAVLLADFAAMVTAVHITDLGTGTGIIPLLLSRRLPNSRFSAVELMPVMVSQARRSVAMNGLSDRIEVLEGDLREKDLLPAAVMDMVTVNPPYYKMGHGRINKDPVFAAARQESCCTLPQIVAAAGRLLKDRGSLCLILPARRLTELTTILQENAFGLRRLRMIHPFEDKPANLFLAEAVKNSKPELTILPSLAVYDSPGIYSREMREIYER